jgi:anti-sigma factor RsiW
MSCSDLHEVISAYADGEATPEERAALEQHMTSCASCRDRAASVRGLKHGISRLEARARPPEAVLVRVERLRFGHERPRPRVLRSTLWGGAALAGILLAFTAGRAWFGGNDAVSLTEELIADHLKYVPEAIPAEVSSSEPDDVRRFFEGKVPFEPVVPSLDGASLIGGRLCRIRGYYEQLLFYEREGRKLSLYVSNRPDTAPGCEGRGGYHVCGHRRDGLSLMLVGDAPKGELRTLLDGARL